MVRRKVGGNFPLESSWMRFGGREGKMRKRKRKKRKKKKKESGVRSCTFSLRFTEIRLSISIGARGKVHLHNESFAWVQESGVFAKLQEVKVSLILWLFLV